MNKNLIKIIFISLYFFLCLIIPSISFAEETKTETKQPIENTEIIKEDNIEDKNNGNIGNEQNKVSENDTLNENNTEINTQNDKKIENNEKDIDNANINTKNEIIDTETKSDNNVLDYIKDRTTRLETKIGLNKETEVEKETDKIKEELNKKTLEKSILEEMKNILEEKTNKITNDLKDKESTLSKLNEDLLKEKEKLVTNNTKIKELEKDIVKYTKLITEQSKSIIKYKEEKIITESKIKELSSNIEELQLYKDKYEKKILEEQKKDRYQLLINIGVYLIFVLIYIGIYTFFQKRKARLRKERNHKKLNRVVILEVLIGLLFVLFTMIYLVVINPGIGIIFVVLGGSIVMSIRPIIASFVSAFNIITNYKLGDIINISSHLGEIKSINLLTTTINLLDENTFSSLNKLVKVPNSYFSEKEVMKLKSNDLHFKEINIKVNFKDLDITFEEFFTEIDNLFFKESIDIINTYKKKRYFLYIKGTGNQEFEFNFKYKDNINSSSSIDIKIIEYIQSVVKDDSKDEKKEKDNIDNKTNKEKEEV